MTGTAEAGTTVAGAEPATDVAQRHFKLGVTLYEERDFAGARAEFRRAHATVPSFRILFNLGQVSAELHDWAAALAYFRAYLELGADAVPAARRQEVERTIVALSGRVARLVIGLDGAGASGAALSIDDLPVEGLGADRTVTVNPGRRRVQVSYPGQPAQTRLLEVASGDRVDLRFQPVVPAAALAAPPAAVLAAARPRPGRAGVWWAWTATGLAGAGAATVGLLAQRASQDLADERARFPTDRGALAHGRRRTQRLALASDALLAGTAVLGAVALYLTLDDPRPRELAERPALGWRF